MMAGCLIRRLLVGVGVLLLLVGIALLSLQPAPAVAAAAWSSTPLTANFTANEQAQIDGDHVVWRAYDGVDWEILLYDLAGRTTRQLTRDTIDESDPRVDGEYVLWMAHEGSRPVLVLYDLGDDTSLRLPESEGVEASPEMKGDLVVWKSGDGQSCEIYLYDIPSGITTRLTTDNYDHSSPKTDGRFVVFEAIPTFSPEVPSPTNLVTNIVLYDHQSKTSDRLADGLDVLAGGAFRPQVGRGLVVWQRGSEKAAEIILYDTATQERTRLTNDNVEDVAPVVGGGKIAWLSWGRADDMHMPHDSPWKVMLYDTATKETKVANESSLSVAIQEDGAILVWSYWYTGPQYVVYDTASGETSELGPGGFLANYGAALDGGRLVWKSYAPFHREDDTTIYLAARDDLPPAAIPPTPPVREFGDIAGSPYAAAIQQLAERGIARGYRTHLPVWSADLYGLEYRPDAPTLRWQFLKMLLAVVGVDPTDHTNQPPFKDVQGLEGGDDRNLRYYVEAGLETGIVRGITPTRFAPFGRLTRAQAVTALVRAAKVITPQALEWPADRSPRGGPAPFGGTLGDFSPVHAQNMRIAEYNGLLDEIVGFGRDWDPWAPMTRGEAARILVALADKL